MNEFSLVCRVLGSLLYRKPSDPHLTLLLKMLDDGELKALWPLHQDELLDKLQGHEARQENIEQDFEHLFVGDTAAVSPYASNFIEGIDVRYRIFLDDIGMPVTVERCDNFGLMLLAASWIEDHLKDNATEQLEVLFETFVLPWGNTFLGKVEAHAKTQFYRQLAMLTREAIGALCEELGEQEDSSEGTE